MDTVTGNPQRGPEMLIQAGEKIHVITRRNFESQLRTHFAGKIDAVDGTDVRTTGYVFIYDERSAQYVRKRSLRTTILDLSESGYIVNLIPSNVNLDELRYEMFERSELFLTDGRDFRLNINEFGAHR